VRDLFLLQKSQTGPGAHPAHDYGYRSLFPLLKWMADENGYSPSSAEVKNEWRNNFASSYALVDLTCSSLLVTFHATSFNIKEFYFLPTEFIIIFCLNLDL
jgi:hypothetical protein